MSGLLVGWVALPLLVGVLLVAAARRVSPIVAYRVTMVTVGLVVLLTLALLLCGEREAGDGYTWLPGMGSMALGLGEGSTAYQMMDDEPVEAGDVFYRVVGVTVDGLTRSAEATFLAP